MLKDILPDKFYKPLDAVGLFNICDIRIRAFLPVTVFCDKEMYFLNREGICKNCTDSTIYATLFDIKYILNQLSSNALYTINDDLVQGFVTIEGGVRIGFSGEMVVVNGVSKTLKNITSLCIRIPHFIKNCSLIVYDCLVKNGVVLSTLFYGKPGSGKTTMLKDMVYQISTRLPNINIAVIDSRREIITGDMKLHNVDIYYSPKVSWAIESVVRSMCPDVIVLDEISIDSMDSILYATSLGVSIIASIHAGSIDNVKLRLNKYSDCSLFDRYVELDSYGENVGQVSVVYSKEYMPIYL